MIKLLLAGADVGMLASAIIRHGPDHLATMLAALHSWLEQRHFASVDSIKGLLSQTRSPDGCTFERVHYMRAVMSLTSAGG